MSYDIHVFDPAAAPLGREALRAWLAGPARDEQPSALITRAVGVLQQFYRPLSEAPDTLTEGEHFADYAPEGALLSLPAPWYDAEDLTAVVHRLATEHGWGFDDVSVTDGMLWRPDPARQVDPTPLAGASLTVENGGTHADPSPALLAASVDPGARIGAGRERLGVDRLARHHGHLRRIGRARAVSDPLDRMGCTAGIRREERTCPES